MRIERTEIFAQFNPDPIVIGRTHIRFGNKECIYDCSYMHFNDLNETHIRLVVVVVRAFVGMM